jgi:hypothetical protein
MIWLACALTIYTGVEYLIDGRRAMTRQGNTAS